MNRWKYLLFALVLSISMLGISSSAVAQEGTPTATESACAENQDETEKVVVGLGVEPGETATGLIVVREVNGETINVYARCLEDGQTVTASKNVNVWSGYPNLEYAQNDACRQAQADADAAGVDGNWNAGFTVLYDGNPVPPSCGVDRPIRSVQKDEVVPAGTIVLQEIVDFGTEAIDVRALELTEDTKAVFQTGYRLQFWVGYENLEAAQNDVCAQAQREAATAALDNGWNAGFTITVDGQPLDRACGSA